MKEDNRLRQKLQEQYPDGDGIAARLRAAKRVHRANNPRDGVRVYCAGNRWLEENAKAVGNL